MEGIRCSTTGLLRRLNEWLSRLARILEKLTERRQEETVVVAKEYTATYTAVHSIRKRSGYIDLSKVPHRHRREAYNLLLKIIESKFKKRPIEIHIHMPRFISYQYEGFESMTD